MIIFLLFFNMTAVSIMMAPLVKRNNISLPLRAWYPFSLESKWIFFLTYLYQTVGLIMAATTSAAVEGLALTFMLQTCAQLEIIIHRLYLLPQLRKSTEPEWSLCKRESRVISKCVKHHIYMYS